MVHSSREMRQSPAIMTPMPMMLLKVIASPKRKREYSKQNTREMFFHRKAVDRGIFLRMICHMMA